MVRVVELPNSRSYLQYIECGSKNNDGGLKDRKLTNKSIRVYADTINPSRCVVTLYKKYMSLRPPDAPPNVMYLQPLPEPRKRVWFLPKAVGHNVLSQAVCRVMEKGGVSGHFTNHSLRRTCATRLYNSGMDEQRIMSVTGHRSVNAVRVYKEMSDEQQEISYIIQAKNSENKENAPPESKKAKLEDDGSSSNKFVQTLSFNNCTVNFQYN